MSNHLSQGLELDRTRSADSAEVHETSTDRESAVSDHSQSSPSRTASSDLFIAALPVSTPGAQDQEWHDQALCAQTDPEAFFPEKGGSTREAKKICTGCEVRAECLSYALAHDERFGIWGGLSERERRRLKRRAV